MLENETDKRTSFAWVKLKKRHYS